MNADERALNLVKKYGLLKKVNHTRLEVTLRREHEFTDNEKKILQLSRYIFKIERHE